MLYSWYVRSDSGIEGWVSEGYRDSVIPWIISVPSSGVETQPALTPTLCAGSLPFRLQIDGHGQVTPGLPNNLRSSPESGTVLGQIPGEAVFRVLEGPVCGKVNHRAWWRVEYEGMSGWTAESNETEYWVQPTQVIIEAIDVATVRSGPSAGFGQLGTISANIEYVVVGKNANGVWLEIRYQDKFGWVCTNAVYSLGNLDNLLPTTDSTDYQCHEDHNGRDGTITGTDPEIAELFFINGIQTSYEEHRLQLAPIAEVFGNRNVLGIYNATGGKITAQDLHDMGIVDALQGVYTDVDQAVRDIIEGVIGKRFAYVDPTNMAVQALAHQIKLHNGSLIIVGHSQGTAIVSAALRLLADEDHEQLERITVYTFGSVAASYPSGPLYFHCVHDRDFVRILPSNMLSLMGSLLDTRSEFAIIESPSFIGDIMTNHSLSSYLEDFKSGKCPSRRGGGGSF